MAKKNKGKKVKGGKVKAGGGLKAVAKAGAAAIGMGGGKKGGRTGRSRKKTVTWYQNEILRQKLKKRLQKIKFGGR